MEDLLLCPICKSKPKIQSLESEFEQMKYFCGTHISCGDWKKTKN